METLGIMSCNFTSKVSRQRRKTFDLGLGALDGKETIVLGCEEIVDSIEVQFLS